jgi:hypothetical protein
MTTPIQVLLVDADSTIPNLALMKLSAWYKSVGCEVTLKKLNIPYYPHQRKIPCNIDDLGEYDVRHCSIIFSGSKGYIEGSNVDYGGSGYSLHKVLAKVVEEIEPDYSIYPDNDTSYGFISRESEFSKFYIDLAAWCNQPGIFKNMDFAEFLKRRHPKNDTRVLSHTELWNQNN